MSHMHVFDTLAFAKKLRDAGYTEAQAEALVEAQSSVFQEMLDSTLATKDDLRQLRHEIVGEIREEMDARFQQVDARFKDIDARFGEVDRRFQGVETRLGSLENRVDKLGLQLTVRLGGMIMISLGIMLAAMRYMTL
jgi:ABC-type phosphate transport system auxiliary subunit